MRTLLKDLDARLGRWWRDTPVLHNGAFVLLILAAWNLSSVLDEWADGEMDLLDWLAFGVALVMIGIVTFERYQIRVTRWTNNDTGLSQRVVYPRGVPAPRSPWEES